MLALLEQFHQEKIDWPGNLKNTCIARPSNRAQEGAGSLLFLAPNPAALLNENCLSSGIKGLGSAGWLAPWTLGLRVHALALLLPVNHLKVSNIPPTATFSISGCPECQVWNAGREQEATDNRCCNLDTLPSFLCVDQFPRGQRSEALIGLIVPHWWLDIYSCLCLLLLLNLASPRWTHPKAWHGDLNQHYSSLSSSTVTYLLGANNRLQKSVGPTKRLHSQLHLDRPPPNFPSPDAVFLNWVCLCSHSHSFGDQSKCE